MDVLLWNHIACCSVGHSGLAMLMYEEALPFLSSVTPADSTPVVRPAAAAASTERFPHESRSIKAHYTNGEAMYRIEYTIKWGGL